MSYSEKLLRTACMPAAASTALPAAAVASHEKRHRCKSCNKKLELIPFNCRCGDYYCSNHRYAEDHSCSYNYKIAGQQQLSITNILIQNDKLGSRI